MRLIFIYGLPATGKLTVARELALLTGYKLFHNHLVVDTLLSVFEFGSEPFVKLREKIWLSVFQQACESRVPGLIFTFAPERTVSAEFIPTVCDLLQEYGGNVEFVELVCPIEELKARIENTSRVEFGKLASVELFEQLHGDGVFDSSHMPVPQVRVDTSVSGPAEAAGEIATALRLP